MSPIVEEPATRADVIPKSDVPTADVLWAQMGFDSSTITKEGVTFTATDRGSHGSTMHNIAKGVDGLGKGVWSNGNNFDENPNSSLHVTIDNVVGSSTSHNVNREPVWGRLSIKRGDVVDERLKFVEGEKSKIQFANVVGTKEPSSLGFFPLEDKKQSRITIPIELAKAAAKSYHTTLFGYFLGPRLHFPVVQRYAKMAWGKFGFNDAMMNENGIYFFKFNDEGRCA